MTVALVIDYKFNRFNGAFGVVRIIPPLP